MKRGHSSAEVRQFILDNVEEHPDDISRIVSQEYGISRQSVNRYLRGLANQGILEERGRTRGKRYELRPIVEKLVTLELTADLEEDRVWRQVLRTDLDGIKRNVLDICHYGFTEIFNNAIEHSQGEAVVVGLKRMTNRVELTVWDDGIGIFAKIAKDLGLEDQRHAILELSKGKLTTDPQHHTGEGVFFATRMFDKFSIMSGDLYFAHTQDGDDWLLEARGDTAQGTFVVMSVKTESDRTTKGVFDEYAAEKDGYGFTRTHVPVSLAIYGDENLVSRSQARRLLARFERFREVLLDFEGVDFIGQAFADEIFRVFRNENPGTHITWIRATQSVEDMITRVTRAYEPDQLRLNLRNGDK